jgi:TolB-like protein
MSLIAELKRRKVFKVALAYGVVAWLVIQVASTIAPQLSLPEWAPRFITLLVLLGFPIALVLAWIFDKTPEGLKVEPAAVGNKRMFAIAGVLAVLALGWYFRASLPGSTPASAPAPPASHPRLAVLPLANFSPDPDNAFFADGLHDDMLTALSRLEGVDLISRTTMQTFRGSPLTLSEIAQKIGATHVIEGSVRRDDLRVRLTVQLIDAYTDDHLWAETFDRPLAEALTLQSTVANAIATTLKVAIAGGAAITPPTTVPAAYDLYLKARLTTDTEDQLQLLDSALLLDPQFSLARAARASAACLLLWIDGTRRVDLAPQARADIDRARQEQPGLPEIEVAEGGYTYRVLRDYPAALAIVDRALAAKGSDVEALMLRAFLLRRLGRVDEALAATRRARELEPTNPNVMGTYVGMHTYYGRYREAIQAADAASASGISGMAEGVEQERAFARFDLTGELEPFMAWAASAAERNEAASSDFWWAQGPTRERLEHRQRQAGERDKRPNSLVYPTALLVATDADALGEKAILDSALDETERHYAALPPDLSTLPEALPSHALYLALRGDSAAAVAEVERAIAAMPSSQDAVIAFSIRLESVYVLARAGAKDRAIEVLQSIVDYEPHPGQLQRLTPSHIYHDKLIRLQLGDDPRYQELMQQIESRFEKL